MRRDLVERARRGDHDAFAELAAAAISSLDGAAWLILRDRTRVIAPYGFDPEATWLLDPSGGPGERVLTEVSERLLAATGALRSLPAGGLEALGQPISSEALNRLTRAHPDP
jgi:hypothetical protein